MLLFYITFLASWFNPGCSQKLASYYQDRMILQRSPQSAVVWGTGQILPGTEAVLYCTDRGEPQFGIVEQIGEIWSVQLPPQEANTVCDIEIAVGATPVTLNSVLFGDVWICSGQSNMEFQLKNVINGSDEVSYSGWYTDIRFLTVPHATSQQELMDFPHELSWADSSDPAALGAMSAVCYLTARNLYDMTGVPQGLIKTCWGGTRIEAWSRPDSLTACDIEDNVDEARPQNSNSALWNAMVAPLTKMRVFGFLWYQGEANSGWNREQYACTFPTLISDWREAFSVASAPWGFVQLSTINHNHTNLNYPVLRRHQNGNYPTVPNLRMKRVFMAVAIDTYDPEFGIHPRYKQIIGERLAVTAMRTAYSQQEFPEHGPLVEYVAYTEEGGLELVFDQEITFTSSELTGFYTCCQEDSVCRDTLDGHYWPEVEPDSVAQVDSRTVLLLGDSVTCSETGTPASLAYLWRETPIKESMWGAPIYSADRFKLPAEPGLWLSSDLPSPAVQAAVPAVQAAVPAVQAAVPAVQAAGQEEEFNFLIEVV